MSRAWPVRGIDPSGPLDANARRILAVKIAEFYSYAPAVAVEAAAEPLHNLRIAAKRLRYTLELFRVIFGKQGERQIERIKAIQEELGAIHDHDVRLTLIEAELGRQGTLQATAVGRALAAAPATEHAAITATALRPPPDDPRRGLIALLGRQHASRRQHYHDFVALWDRFGSEGMRADLVAISTRPIGDAGEPETA